jgi:hypothetical protein
MNATMPTPRKPGGSLTMWICTWCGGGAEDEEALLDHQEWCLGEAGANTLLLKEVAERDGELTQEALVTAAHKKRRPGR